MRKLPLLALVLLLFAAAPAASLDQPELKTEDQKTLYALGLVIAQNLSSFALSPADLEIVKAGIADGVTSKEKKVDLQTYGGKCLDGRSGLAIVPDVSGGPKGRALR